MTKSKKKSLDATKQTTIFDWLKTAEEITRQSAPHPSGSLNFHAELCAAMSSDIKHAIDENGRELSRYDVAAKMSNLLDREISKSTLDNWTAISHDAHIPDAIEIAAFVRATGGQRRAIEVVAGHAGIFALPGADALRAEIHRIEEMTKQLKQEKHKATQLLSAIEGRKYGR